MGKVRPKYAKVLAKKLLELYPDRFSDSFEHNKRAVSELADIGSKKVRNMVAGCITHLVKMKEEAEEVEEYAVE